MKQTILALSATVAALALAPSANAAIVDGISFAPGVLTDAFTGTANGDFDDTYNFILPVDSDALALVSSIGFSGLLGDVNFSSVTLDGFAFDFENGTFDSTAAVFVTGLAAGPDHYIRVVGSSLGNGSYSGNITLYPAAVPEPATWAMMIAGFGLAGVALRRRSTAARNMAVSFV